MVNAGDIMRRDVYTIRAEDRVRDLLNLFAERQVSGVPVVDEKNTLLGIITDADILGELDQSPSFIDALTFIVVVDTRTPLAEKIKELLEVPVGKLMTKRVVTVTEDTDLAEVAKILSNRQFKKVPVVKGRRLVGVVSRGDVVSYLVREFLAKTGPER